MCVFGTACLDLYGHEVLFVSAASLMFYLHVLLHIIVLRSRVALDLILIPQQKKSSQYLHIYNTTALQGRAQSLIEILI